ncbi:hypothetical protein HQQ80_19230 [Microbacteriaceae bacterium VKM Ac-2855]|nr:hypothetical protein [Microbacteriaceae bacterium VKM Ac-2855]
MKRVEVTYGGVVYSLHDTDAATVCAQVDEALLTDTPTWLIVNSGEGLPRETRILIVRGVPVAVTNAAQ